MTAIAAEMAQPTSTPEPVRVAPERPIVDIVGDTVPRIRNALESVVTGPRQRTTLIIILIIAGILAIGAFGYLIFRRR